MRQLSAATGLFIALALPLAAQRPAPAIDSARYVRTTAPTDPVIQAMWTEGMEKSQAMDLAQVLMDSIGPRLVNSDRYNAGQQWLLKTYAGWGVSAKREQWGTWNAWQRGATHVDLIAPRIRSLEAVMLAWSPGTGGKDVIGDVILYPDVAAPEDFAKWLPQAKGKFILGSAPNPSCRASSQWTEFGQPGSAARLDSTRRAISAAWADRTKKGGNPFLWQKDAGVAGMITTNFSGYPGVDKVFGSWRQQVPYVDVTCEDYNLLYRLAEKHQGPRIKLNADSKFLGENPVFNVIAEIKGSEKPDEYIVLSAHYDSWDGASGATDNGTGTITMLEAMRILKTTYPHPRRTIIVGHWGGEEQGLNGSRSFVEDHPEVVKGLRAGWNQDNGTGRVVGISPGPFPNAPETLAGYLAELPSQITGWIKIGGPGSPGSGGSDHSSFQCAKGPLFGLGALNWDYFSLTWHTNRDTYDKLVPEDLKNNATLVAMLTYEADRNPDSSPMALLTALPNGNEVKYECPKAVRKTADSPR
ncbi:MAG: M20/M25/M40 family metallo-hydrolase [Gemmatimonadota bacterium]